MQLVFFTELKREDVKEAAVNGVKRVGSKMRVVVAQKIFNKTLATLLLPKHCILKVHI